MEEINFLDLDLSLNVDEDVDVHTPATDSDRDIHPPTAGFDDDLVTESDGARARTPQFNSTTDIDNTSDTADSENDAMRNMAAGCSGSQESRQRNTKTSTVWHGCWEARYQSYFCDENQEIREDDRRRRFASAGLSYYRQGNTRNAEIKMEIPVLYIVCSRKRKNVIVFINDQISVISSV